jgi:hypothetical protein
MYVNAYTAAADIASIAATSAIDSSLYPGANQPTQPISSFDSSCSGCAGVGVRYRQSSVGLAQERDSTLWRVCYSGNTFRSGRIDPGAFAE